LSFKKPYYIGFAYLWGYFGSLILRGERIDNKEIRDYYGKRRTIEVIRHYLSGLKRRNYGIFEKYQKGGDRVVKKFR